MKQKLRVFLTLLLCAVASVGWGQTTVTDELTYDLIGVTGNNYSSWSGKTSNSTAIYAGQSAGSYNSIQLRSKNSNSGIVTTSSGGKVKSVIVVLNSNTTASGRLDVYGKNTAYTSPEDLYSVDNQGTRIGSVLMSDEETSTITISDDYEYIGFRSYNGAVYVDKITIVWENSTSSAVTTNTTINSAGITNTDVYEGTAGGQLTATVTANGTTIEDATVTWSSSNTDVATIDASGIVTLVAAGTTTITAYYAGVENQYMPSEGTCKLTVTDSTPFSGGDVTFDATQDKGTSPLFKNGVSFACDNGVLNNGTEYRLYKNSTTTFSVSEGVITQITFTGVSSNPASGFATQTGWTTDENNGTWTGNAQSVSFTASDAQVRATQIVVTVDMNATPDPIINASDVNIAYDATSGSIAYTIGNPVAGTSLRAAVTGGNEGNWLTLGEVGESSVLFTSSANETTEPRTATVTLTYDEVTKEVIVTQAAAPLIYTTIPALFAAATSTETDVTITFGNWVVSGVSTNGKNIFVTDNNGNGFVIYYGSDMSSTFSAGNILSGTVSCKLKKYNGFAELVNLNADDLTITDGGSVTTSSIAMADLAGVNTGALVSYENLTCSVDNNKYYLTDGTTTIQVYNSLYAFNALEAGKTYNITGVYQQYNTTKEVMPRSAADIVEVEVPVQTTITAGTLSHVAISSLYDGDMEDITLGDNVTEGTLVYFTLSVDEGYNLESVTVLNANNEEVTLTENQGSWSFTMPNSSVTINATATSSTPATGDQYSLFTGDLVEGDYIIYYNGKAMNTTITNNRLQYAEVTPANNVISTDNTAIVWHIAKSGDYWTIYNADADAYAAATSSNNQAQMLADGTNDKALWTVSDEYDFTNKANSRLLRNNGTYGFACYGANTGGALSLYKKVEAITLSDVNSDDLPESANPANVTLTRKFVNKWNPICLPFDVTDLSVFGEGYEVVKFTGDADNNGNVSLKFETVDKMVANVPYMVWVNEDADVSEPWVLTFNGVNYNPFNNPVSAGTNYNYVGVYKNYAKGTSPIVTGDVILSGGAYKTVTGNGGNAIKGFRGYWKKSATAGEAKSITAIINGQETDDIKYIELVETLTDGIFNLQGQKVNHAQKGVFIVNGKKVVIK